MAEARKRVSLSSLAHAAPDRLPYKDEEPEDVEMFPEEAEAAADAAATFDEQLEARTKAALEQRQLYHAVVLTGMHAEVVSALTKTTFAKLLSAYHPDQILVMVRGKKIPKIVKPTLAL